MPIILSSLCLSVFHLLCSRLEYKDWLAVFAECYLLLTDKLFTSP